MIINLLATWIPALIIALLGVLKLAGNRQVAHALTALGVGRHLRVLGVMELAFATLFVMSATFKLGFLLASCDCTGAIATELSHRYRRPFLEAGDDRWPTLQWAREVPLSGEPADVHDRIAVYSAWLKTASLPKLFIDAEPSVFITG